MIDLCNRATIFSSLPHGGIGAEIGVAGGEHAEEMLQLAEPRMLYLIDPWHEQSTDVYGADPANVLHAEKYRRCLQCFTLNASVKVIKAYSVDAATLFPDGHFDWVYIDANHMRAYEDCVAWWGKVKRGGFVMGHDWLPDGVTVDFITVKEDVQRFVGERGLQVYITEDEGTNYKSWVIPVP